LSAIEGLRGDVGSSGNSSIAVHEAVDPALSRKLKRYTGWLPLTKTFEVLIADPQWPRFSESVQF
jgi:hypothetical protein